jgi:hypothetical protein
MSSLPHPHASAIAMLICSLVISYCIRVPLRKNGKYFKK